MYLGVSAYNSFTRFQKELLGKAIHLQHQELVRIRGVRLEVDTATDNQISLGLLSSPESAVDASTLEFVKHHFL